MANPNQVRYPPWLVQNGTILFSRPRSIWPWEDGTLLPLLKTAENNGLGTRFASITLSPRCHSQSFIESVVAPPLLQLYPLEAAENSSSPLLLFFSSSIPTNVPSLLPSPFWNSFTYVTKSCQGWPCFLTSKEMLKGLLGVSLHLCLLLPLEAEPSSLDFL